MKVVNHQALYTNATPETALQFEGAGQGERRKPYYRPIPIAKEARAKGGKTSVASCAQATEPKDAWTPMTGPFVQANVAAKRQQKEMDAFVFGENSAGPAIDPTQARRNWMLSNHGLPHTKSAPIVPSKRGVLKLIEQKKALSILYSDFDFFA